MKTKFNIRFILPALVAILLLAAAFIAPSKPVFYIIGDSTTRNSNRPQCGWGEVVGELFDTIKINISNQAMAGRSTRTFISEGRWDKVMSTIKPGDHTHTNIDGSRINAASVVEGLRMLKDCHLKDYLLTK